MYYLDHDERQRAKGIASSSCSWNPLFDRIVYPLQAFLLDFFNDRVSYRSSEMLRLRIYALPFPFMRQTQKQGIQSCTATIPESHPRPNMQC